MFHYKVYDIEIASEIEMPSAYVSDGSRDPQIIIRVKKMDDILELCKKTKKTADEENGKDNEEVDLTKKDDEIIYLPGFALFRICGGKEIFFHEIEKTDKYQVEQWLLNRCITCALTQRGEIIIHCSGLDKDGELTLLSGESGSGKSTLADKLLERKEYKFASDDTVRIEIRDGKLIGYGAYPLRRLCLDAVERNGYDKESVIRIDDGEREKYGVSMKDVFTCEGRSVNSLFILNPSDEADAVRVDEITGSYKLEALTDCIYNYTYYKKNGLNKDMFFKMVLIANNLRIYRVSRPVKGMTVNEVAENVNKIFVKN